MGVTVGVFMDALMPTLSWAQHPSRRTAVHDTSQSCEFCAWVNISSDAASAGVQVNRHSADPSITEAAEKEDALAQQLDNLEAQVRLLPAAARRNPGSILGQRMLKRLCLGVQACAAYLCFEKLGPLSLGVWAVASQESEVSYFMKTLFNCNTLHVCLSCGHTLMSC